MDDHRSPDVAGLLDPLRRYARSLTRSDSQADDLVQGALVRALERQHAFRPDGQLRTWLFSILHNLFVDERRSRQADMRRAGQSVELAETAERPDQEPRVRLRQVARMFDLLPSDQRAALHLVAVEELSYGEAAAALGISVNTLTSRLGRARAALREMEAGRAEPRPALRVVGGSDV